MRGVALLALAVILAAATPTEAQVETAPDIYLWGKSWTGQEGISGFASQMVRVYVDTQQYPQNVALTAVSAAHDQIDDGRTAGDQIAILLQNFGEYAQGAYRVSLIDADDAVDPELIRWDGGTPQAPMPYRQPWMNTGRGKVKQWMAGLGNQPPHGFLYWYAYYAAQPQYDVPLPVRFHFDTEGAYAASCCEVNWTRLLEGVSRDSRWSTEPVPGFGTQTMAQLYGQACDDYHWDPDLPLGNPDPDIHNNQALDHDSGPFSDQNRPYFLWYYTVTQKAFDAAMKECAYDRIHDWAVEHDIEEQLKASNYGDANTDGQRDTFGWYTGQDDQEPNGLIASRYSIRGMTDPYNEGARYDWIYDEELDPEFQYRQWMTRPGVRSGHFDSPFLYPYSPAHWIGDINWGERLNYYHVGHPLATPQFIYLSNGRRWVESVLNTPGGDPADLVPWVAAPYTKFHWSEWGSGNDYQTDYSDTRRTLAMLRAKKTPEVIVWWASDIQQTFSWAIMQTILKEVYVPQVDDYWMLLGWESGTHHTDKLRYTLRGVPSVGDTADVSPLTHNGYRTMAMKVRYNNMQSGLSSGKMEWTLECSIEPENANVPPSDLRGFIYVYKWAANPARWELLSDLNANDHNFDDFGIGTGFGQFAPVDENGRYEIRRTFTDIPKYINTQGQLDLKLVLQRYSGQQQPVGFTAHIDLAQLVGDGIISSGASGIAQGADYNYTQTIEAEDLIGFAQDWMAGAAAADFDNDGDIDQDDYEAFVTAYNNP